MRYPAGHKEETRRRILTAASALFRKRGIRATGLPDVMKAAGLTVGGFYRHFDSKAELFREAVNASLRRTLAFLRHAPSDLSDYAWRRGAVARYLSRDHLANVEQGCPLPSLTPEIARAEPEVKEIYGEALRQMVDELELRMPAEEGCTPRQKAWGFMATSVGGLMLARAVDDPDLANEILEGCRRSAVPDRPDPDD